jgi:TetR/AcrR family transcriptional regulator, transcriptional repressor for nem operon
MPGKGERTRSRILQRSAALMNRHGFSSASMAAVVEASGIQKGGLYRHFESREALVGQAFGLAVTQVRARFVAALEGKLDACEQLLALLDAYEGAGTEVPLPGGCPIMNAAIESDHAHPELRELARSAMTGWHAMISAIVERGLRRRELRSALDPAEVANVFIACIEGGVMLTQLYNDERRLGAALRHLRVYIDRELRPVPASPSAKEKES